MTPVGRVIIALQGTLLRAEFRSDQERDEFCQHLVKTMDESMRQKLLGWRFNRTQEAIQRAKEPPTPEPSVPDHISNVNATGLHLARRSDTI